MSVQNYQHHKRYYIPHHFIFYPVVLTSGGVSLFYMFRFPEQKLEWLAIAGLFLVVAWLSFMMRQHYALNNQNRIVRLEMEFRYFILTQKRLDIIGSTLSFGQVAALRFASDEELAELVERAVKEDLSADAIKKSVKHWRADQMRA